MSSFLKLHCFDIDSIPTQTLTPWSTLDGVHTQSELMEPPLSIISSVFPGVQQHRHEHDWVVRRSVGPRIPSIPRNDKRNKHQIDRCAGASFSFP